MCQQTADGEREGISVGQNHIKKCPSPPQPKERTHTRTHALGAEAEDDEAEVGAVLQVHKGVEQELLPVRAGGALVAHGGGRGESLDVVDDKDEGRLLEGAWRELERWRERGVCLFVC